MAHGDIHKEHLEMKLSEIIFSETNKKNTIYSYNNNKQSLIYIFERSNQLNLTPKLVIHWLNSTSAKIPWFHNTKIVHSCNYSELSKIEDTSKCWDFPD